MRVWQAIRLVAGGGMVMVLGAAALMLWPLLWPPDPDASVQLISGHLMGETSGYVGRVNRDAQTVDVSSSLIGWRPIVLVVNEQTSIQVQNRQGGFGDLLKDLPVRVTYEVVGDRRIAKSIEVMVDDRDGSRVTSGVAKGPGDSVVTPLVDTPAAGLPAPPPATRPTEATPPEAAAPRPAVDTPARPAPAGTPSPPVTSAPSRASSAPERSPNVTVHPPPIVVLPERPPKATAPERSANVAPPAPVVTPPSARVTPPKAPAPTVEAPKPAPEVPRSVRSAAPPERPLPPTVERPTPAPERRERPAPSDADPGDGAAAIDWLLKRR